LLWPLDLRDLCVLLLRLPIHPAAADLCTEGRKGYKDIDKSFTIWRRCFSEWDHGAG
jgi:hypothetical protein